MNSGAPRRHINESFATVGECNFPIIQVVANHHFVLISSACRSSHSLPNLSIQYIAEAVKYQMRCVVMVWLCGHAGDQLQHALQIWWRGASSKQIVGLLEIDLDEASWWVWSLPVQVTFSISLNSHQHLFICWHFDFSPLFILKHYCFFLYWVAW